MNKRIKIERKLIISPSMQLFRVGAQGNAHEKGHRDATKLQHIRDKYEKTPEAQEIAISDGQSVQDSDEDSLDNDLREKKEAAWQRGHPESNGK